MNLLRRIWPGWTRDIDYDRRENIDWRDEWVESEHPRVPAGSSAGGQFAGTNLPAPGTLQVAKQGSAKKLAQSVSAQLTGGVDPHEIAKALKQYGENYSYSGYASYANQLLQHVEQAHGLAPGTLGKAKAKPKIKGAEEPPEMGPPSEAEMEAMQEPEGEITPGAMSPAQVQMQEILETDWSDEEKLAWMKSLAQDIPEGDTEGQLFASAVLHKLEHGGEQKQQMTGLEGGAGKLADDIDILAGIEGLSPADKIGGIQHLMAKNTLAPEWVHKLANAHIAKLQESLAAKPVAPPGVQALMSKWESEAEDYIVAVGKNKNLTLTEKIETIKTYIGNKKTYGEIAPGGLAETYANNFIEQLEQEGGEEAKPGPKVPESVVVGILNSKETNTKQKWDILQQLKAKAIELGHDPGEITKKESFVLPMPTGSAITQEMWEVAAHPTMSLADKVKQLKWQQAHASTVPDTQYAGQLIDFLTPTSEAAPTKAPKAALLPLPDPGSETQKGMLETATMPGWTAEQKAKQLYAEMNGSTKADVEYGQKLLAHVLKEHAQTLPQGPAKPAAVPVPDPPSGAPQLSMKLHTIAKSGTLTTTQKLNQIKSYDPAHSVTKAYQKQLIAALEGGAPDTSLPEPDKAIKGQITIHNYATAGPAGGASGMTKAEKLQAIEETINYYQGGYNEGAIKAYGEQAKAYVNAQTEAEQPQPPPADLPSPAPGSTTQTNMHAIASAGAPVLNSTKIEQIKKALAASGGSTGGKAETYANQLIAKLGGQPTTVEAAQAEQAAATAPAATPAPAASTGAAKAGVTQTANKLNLAAAKKIEAKAVKVHNASAAAAVKACKTLDRDWWKDPNNADPQSRQACISYKGGSSAINGALRAYDLETGEQKGHHTDPHLQEEINRIDNLFDHEDTALEQDLVLRRGEAMKHVDVQKMIAGLTAGKHVRITRKGFMSGSAAATPPSSWKNEPIQWEVIATKGTRALGVFAADPSFDYENEVLLRHGTTLDIYEIEKKGHQWFIRARTL